MPTENPKVSAYVPQTLKDRLKEFREERDISESQAVIIILAEYFQMPEVLGRSLEGSSVGGVTLARMEAIEERLTDFVVLVEHRLQHLQEEIEKISGLSVVHQTVLDEINSESEQRDSLLSKPLVVSQELEQVIAVGEEQNSSFPEQLLAELLNQKDNEEEKLEEPQEVDSGVIPGELVNELSVNEDGKQQGSSVEAPEVAKKMGELTSSLQGEPLEEKTNHSQIPLVLGVEESEEVLTRIDIDLLAPRLRMTAGSVRNKRSKLNDEDFVKWTATKDINEISWRVVKEGKRVYYEPATALDGEPLSMLLTWIRENRN